MHVRRARTLLAGFTALMAVGALALPFVFLVIRAPGSASDTPTISTVASSEPPTPNSSASADRTTAEAWDRVSNLRLRPPLYDPPPVTQATAAPPPPAPLTLRLVGTVVEPEPHESRSVAMLATRQGTIELKRVGQRVEDGGALLEVVAVETGSVSLRRGEQTLTLKMEPEGAR